MLSNNLSLYYLLTPINIFRLEYLSSSEHITPLVELLHSEEFSQIENNDKVPVIVDLGRCPEIEAKLYNLHPCRELYYNATPSLRAQKEITLTESAPTGVEHGKEL